VRSALGEPLSLQRVLACRKSLVFHRLVKLRFTHRPEKRYCFFRCRPSEQLSDYRSESATDLPDYRTNDVCTSKLAESVCSFGGSRKVHYINGVLSSPYCIAVEVALGANRCVAAILVAVLNETTRCNDGVGAFDRSQIELILIFCQFRTVGAICFANSAICAKGVDKPNWRIPAVRIPVPSLRVKDHAAGISRIRPPKSTFTRSVETRNRIV